MFPLLLCADAFLSALTNHPQVLRALRGVNFKETGCYLPPSKGVTRVDSPNHRMNCFPFIEKHESNFIYGDATVTYSSSFEVPFYLQQDNPNIKSLFVIRNPIRRLESHFRFDLNRFKSLGFGTVDEASAHAMRAESQLHSLRSDAEELLAHMNTFREVSNADLIRDSISLDQCLSSPWILFFRFDDCRGLFLLSGRGDIHWLEKQNKISLYISNFFVPGNAKTMQDRTTSNIVRTSLYFPGV
jgi:hypothetical protein